jgi:hypothetical protein
MSPKITVPDDVPEKVREIIQSVVDSPEFQAHIDEAIALKRESMVQERDRAREFADRAYALASEILQLSHSRALQNAVMRLTEGKHWLLEIAEIIDKRLETLDTDARAEIAGVLELRDSGEEIDFASLFADEPPARPN